MAKKEFDRLIEEHYGISQKEMLDFDFLCNLITEQMAPVNHPEKVKELIKEAVISYDAIPEIPVSELGWSDVRTTKEGTEVAGPQRAALENYLSNIKGTDLSEKIASLSEFYSGEFEMPEDITPAAKISMALSYLTFYKTLTSVIQNFNAASAGFSFESFLGALLKGTQVPTGEGTIADLIAGDGTPISLKLYAEKGVKVEGSWTDLVNDLVDGPGYMQYVVCMKNLTGKGMEQEGSIKFYRFNFTLDNVMAINAKSRSHSQIAMQLPAAFIENPSDISASLPSRKSVSPEELEKAFAEYIRRSIEDTEAAEGLLQTLDWAKRDDLFNKNKKRGSGDLSKSAVRLAVDKSIEVGLFSQDRKSELFDLIIAANQAAITYVKGAGERRVAALSEMEFASSEESAAFYENLTPDQKKLALKNSRGYLYTDQFFLNRTDVLNIASYATVGLFPEGQQEVSIGQINIGASYIQEMLDRVTTSINTSVFEIISNVKILTTNINSYFAGGLQDDKNAETAIKAADTIEGKTEELRDKDK